jgi:methylmalonyl-CoA mutase
MKLIDLHDFAHSSLSEWQKAIQKELGERTIESLNWSPEEGILMQPYYSGSPAVIEADLGVEPFLIHQSYSSHDVQITRQISLECLAGGAQSLGLFYPGPSFDLDDLLKGIEWPFIQLHWSNFELTQEACNTLLAYTKLRGWNARNLKGIIGLDAHNLWTSDIKMEDIRYLNEHFNSCRIFYIDGVKLANEGATPSQQLVAILAQVQEALYRLTQMGFSIDEASAMIQINVSVGTSYFSEMTKLKTLRYLFGLLIDGYQPVHNCSKSIWIHAVIGGIDYAGKDKQTNLLRATTASMSAVLGRASSVEVTPYDSEVDANYALRLSRNMLHILREESKFDEARHAFKGSYYLEEMYAQLKEKVWTDFVDMEEGGGWTIKEGDWLLAAHHQGEQKNKDILAGVKIKVGVNKYQIKGND